MSPEPGHLQGHRAGDVIFLSSDEFSSDTAWSQLTCSVQTEATVRGHCERSLFLAGPYGFPDSQIKWNYFLWKQEYFSSTVNNLFSMERW